MAEKGRQILRNEEHRRGNKGEELGRVLYIVTMFGTNLRQCSMIIRMGIVVSYYWVSVT